MNNYGMLGVFISILNTYIMANRINDRVISNMDKYFPKKKKKLGYFFFFYKKGQPVRWLAYWIEFITQILTALFIVSLLLGNLITSSWDFVTVDFLLFWISLFWVYPVLFEIVIEIYTFIRDHSEMYYKDEDSED